MAAPRQSARLLPVVLVLAFPWLLQPPLHGQGGGDPTGLTAQVSGTNVTLSWLAPAAPPVLALPASTLVFSTMAPPGTYYVRVAAGTAAGVGPPSNEVTVTTAVACMPTMPLAPSATVVPGAVSLRWFARSGPAATGYRLLAGSESGGTDIGIFDFPATTTLIGTPAASRRYFVRLIAFNACGPSAPSSELSFVVPPTNLPSLVGTWDGTITNHVPRPSGLLITSFTLQLNTNPPFAGSTHGRFTSTGCDHGGLVGFYQTSTGAPQISMESLDCTDGDFGLIIETLSATTAEGPCSLGGPNCRFSMTKR